MDDKNSNQKYRRDGASSPEKQIHMLTHENKYMVWAHYLHTGWRYCVTIPSWITGSESKAYIDGSTNNIAFFRVLVRIQSPEGFITSHVILRRFSTFLKLNCDVKKVFHKKHIPPAPPKNSLSKVNSSQHLLEERRYALEEWLWKLLSDVEISQSPPILTFLEIPAAIGDITSVQENLHPSDTNSLSDNSLSTKKKPGELYSWNKDDFTAVETDGFCGFPKEHKLLLHARNHSIESIRSNVSSVKGSEISKPSRSNSLGDISAYFHEASESMDLEWTKVNFVCNTVEQRQKLNKLILSTQQRLETAQADMEDLITQLNQEIADKEYFKAKVKDLEMELESIKKASKEDFQKAIFLERDKLAKIQWDTDELRRKYATMESLLRLKQNEKACAESDCANLRDEKEHLLHELDNKTEELKKLQRHQDEFEIKSKSDIRALVKEVKFLRSSQEELKETVSDLQKEKNNLERFIEKEKERKRHNNMARKKVIYECEDLRHRFQESSVNFLVEEEDKFTVDSASLLDALGLLSTSDTRIGVLLAKAQLIRDVNKIGSLFEHANYSAEDLNSVSDDEDSLDAEMRRLLSNTIIDCAILRKQINSVLRCALKTIIKPLKESSKDGSPVSAFLHKIFKR